jgi:hypothetical protein
MTTSAASVESPRGPELIVEHCARLSRLQRSREPARRRLERRVGTGLAHLLVFALAGNHAPRRDVRCGRGSSSP